MKNFKLTDETMVNEQGVTLYRLEFIKNTIYGRIGDKGGWVESVENISGNARYLVMLRYMVMLMYMVTLGYLVMLMYMVMLGYLVIFGLHLLFKYKVVDIL